jgi:hypothetical protein
LISIEDDAEELLTNGKRARRSKRFMPFPGGKQKELSGHGMPDGAFNYKDDEELAFFLSTHEKGSRNVPCLSPVGRRKQQQQQESNHGIRNPSTTLWIETTKQPHRNCGAYELVKSRQEEERSNR